MIFFSSAANQNSRAPYLRLLIDPLINNYPESTYMRIFVNSIVLQNDFDTITSNNDAFTYNGTVYNLPHGQPTISDIVKYMNSVGIECEYSSNDDRIEFKSNGTLSFPSPSCAVVLGFIDGETYTVLGGDLSPNSVFLDAHDVLYLTSSLVSKNFEIKQGKTEVSSIISSIANIAAPYQTIAYCDTLGEYAIIEKNRRFLNTMTFVLTDTSGSPLSIRAPWYASIVIEYLNDVETSQLSAIEGMTSSIQGLVDIEKRKMILESLDKKKLKVKKK